jgi:outer membrane protein assembly factor BamB
MWMLSSWDSSEAFMTKPDTIREILACAANKQALYLVYGEKKAGYRLAVISNQGKFLWTYWLGDISQAYLLPDDDGGIFATVSFNKNSSSNAGKKAGTGSSTLNTGKVYKFLIDNGIYPTWQQTLKTSSKLSAPVQYMGKVLYITGGNKLFALNVADGSIIWEEPLLNLVSPPSIDSHTERIYAGSSDGNLFAVDQSGHMVWNRTLDSSINHSPLIGSDGFLYVFTEKGSLYKIKDKI